MLPDSIVTARRSPDATEFVATIDGRRTSVFCYGDDSAPTILAIHGFRGTHFGLEPLAAKLAARGYRVLVPDLPGCGTSEPLATPHDVAGFGRWLCELSASLGSPGILLGHSFGSVVVSAAIARGIAHSGSVLVNPIAAPPLDNPHRLALAAVRAYYGLADRLTPALSAALLGSRSMAAINGRAMVTTRDRELKRWIIGEHIRRARCFSGPDALLETYRASVQSMVPDFAQSYREPVLVLGGDLDLLSTVEMQRRLADQLPRSSFWLITGVGHLIPYEACDTATQHIQHWQQTMISAGACDRVR